MGNKQQRLKNYIEEAVSKYGGIRPAARAFNCNPGIVANVLSGGDSPTLRQELGLRKWPKRDGIFISCSEDIRARFDAQATAANRTRSEYLIYLLDLDCGELPY